MIHSDAAVTPLRPRITHPQPSPDLQAAARAAASFLAALGVDISSEATADTPHRMARAYAEMLAVPSFDMTTFPNDEGYDELVLVEAIPMRSLCEHHMLPFTGTAHIGYLPADRILGLSKFARLIAFFASRPQTQERLTKQIADELRHRLQPHGVGVVIVAEHACTSHRGARAHGARTVTSALYGGLRDTCGPSRTASGCARRWPPAPGSRSSERAGSGWKSRRRHGKPGAA